MKPHPPGLHDRLRTLGTQPDNTVAVGEVALCLSAAVYGHASINAHQRHLQALADAVNGYTRGAADTLDLRTEALARILSAHYGYGTVIDPSDEDDSGANPLDACLISTIDRRRGSGLAVGILYLHTARAVGWEADGLDFPGRFLVRLNLGVERAILDPLGQGRRLSPPDLRALLKETAGYDAELSPAHYRPMENRAIIFRYHNDLKMRLLRQGRLEDALRVAEAMLQAVPHAAALWREVGLINARLDNIPAAVLALEEYLRLGDSDDDRYKATQLLRELREQLP